MARQPAPEFSDLLRQLRAEAGLTQEELAEAAGLSPRTVSDLERGIHRLAQQDTARLLAGALGLDEPLRGLFMATARGRVPAVEVLATRGGLRRDAGGADGRQPDVEQLLGAVVGSPYRGLKAFEEQDAAFFFGREAATAALMERMSRLVAGTGLLVVAGASGAGKSSLLRAGVLPQIRKAGLEGAPEAASWPHVVFTPTRAPLDELALQVGPLVRADAASVRRGMEADPAGFALTVRQAAQAQPQGPPGDRQSPMERDQPPPQQRVVLLVDQFEQVFTLCPDEGQRREFIAALHAAATTGHGPEEVPAGLVVLGVRADFEARCADYPQLADAVQDRYLVTAMTQRQLRMAITEPAKKAGSPVDDDLVDVLLNELGTGQHGAAGAGGAGALPLLSHALDQAWRSRAGNAVTLADYERTGGIEGAVAASAQRAYERLTPAQQTAARHVFTRLTATSSSGADSADRATRAELTDGKTPSEIQDVEQVLEAFAAERLLTLAAGVVEISHEVLLTAWPLLRDTWLADTHEDRIVRTRLRTTATEWASHSRDPSYLYTGNLLAAATGAAARISADPTRHPSLTQTERDFLHASNHAYRRTRRMRQAAIAGLLVLTLTAITVAGIAVHNAATAARQHTFALSRQLAAESLTVAPINPVIARRLAVAAWAVSPTEQASSAMTTLLAEQQQSGVLPADPTGVSDVAFSPNGKLLASVGDDGAVQLWNPATGQAVGGPLQNGSGAQGGVSAVAFSPNGKLLASASGNDGIVRLWNPLTRQPLGEPFPKDRWGVYTVAFSPNGKLLASEDGNGTVRAWNLVTRQPFGTPLQTHGSQIGLLFNPQGELVAADSKGASRLWNLVTHRSTPLLTGSGARGVYAVAFSPHGNRLATGSSNGTMRLWNPATGQPIGNALHAASSHTGLLDVAFSSNGKLLASADSDGTVRLWNPVTRQPVGAPLRVSGAQIQVTAMAFSPDGKVLATADSDGTVRLWNSATSQPAGAAIHAASSQSGILDVAFSPDSKLLASADDGRLRLWDPATGAPAGMPLQKDPYGVTGVTFSRDGTMLAAVDGVGTVRVWNPVTRQPVGTPIRTGANATGGIWAVALSPNGKLLAAPGSDGTVRLWNPATGRPVGAPIHATDPRIEVSAVAFSPNGKLLAAIDHGGTVRVWNALTHQPAGPAFHGGPEQAGLVGLERVAFSPNSKLLASATADGAVRVWNAVTGQPVAAPIPAIKGPSSGVFDVAFSPDGKLLATADSDGTVELWNPLTSQPVGAPLETGALSGVYGVAFSPDGQWLATADSDGTIHLWKISLLRHPYAALCADVGPPTPQDWAKYAPGEHQPKICA